MRVEELQLAVKAAAQKLFGVEIEPEITRPDEQFGDYATNAALQLAKQLGRNPREVADQLAKSVIGRTLYIETAEVAGPGFINFKLTDEALFKAAFSAADLPEPFEGQEILVEFGDPNPFKEMHVGHLYSYIVGDAIASLLQAAGADVKRLSYHGDVGRQVAQAIWGMRQIEVTDEVTLGQAYAIGAKAYEEDERAKAEIDNINQHVYSRDDPAINELHEKGVKVSFEAFDKILNMLSISTDKRYLESQTTPAGLELVKNNVGQVFKLSQGAVVFDGEKVGLHTRVFITSNGLPTYETKDLGLVKLKDRDFPKASQSIVITANEQSEYFKVMLAALAEIDPPLSQKTNHLSHGFLSLTTGKMSSRTGNVYTAKALLDGVKEAVHAQYPDSPAKNQAFLAAVKYDLLKHRLGSDIIFDVKESVSLEGNSGPYLQYAYARANSIINGAAANASNTFQGQPLKDNRLKTAQKSSFQGLPLKEALESGASLEAAERSLARKTSEYSEVVAKAASELMPHHICTYLYELAQTFNSFYEKNRIIGDEREALRLELVKSYSRVLQSGLKILNIEAPERM